MYSSLFSLSFNFTHFSAGRSKATIRQALFFVAIIIIVVVVAIIIIIINIFLSDGSLIYVSTKLFRIWQKVNF